MLYPRKSRSDAIDLASVNAKPHVPHVLFMPIASIEHLTALVNIIFII